MATAPSRPDAVLVERLRQRDRTAWDELYAEYGPRLRAFAYRLTGSTHDADDLVQETFVRALPRLDRLDSETVQLGPYLFTTLRNTFLKGAERGRRMQPVEDVPEPDEPRPIEDDPERSTLLVQQQEEVRVANTKLAPRQRLVLALRELEDKSYSEIGAIVGLNENAVAQLISRARESLRLELRLAQLDPERAPEACRTYLPLLSRHLDGQLREPKLAETLAHLEGCAYCQDALDSMREAGRRYRILPLPLGGDDAHAARIDTELTAARYWAGHRRRLPVATLVAAVLLLALGAAGAGSALLLADDDPVALAVTSAKRSITGGATAPPLTAATAPTTKAKAKSKRVEPPATTTTAPPQTTGTTATSSTTTAPTTTAAPVAPPPPPTVPARTVADTTAPTVHFVSRPSATTTSTSASFAFGASEQHVTFSCRLDAGSWGACHSPSDRSGLVLGSHAFTVRATDRAGNTGAAATARWTVATPPDTTAPTTTITNAQTSGGNASFSFAADEPGATFSCSLDGGAPGGCASPASYSGLAPGPHTFSVRAKDPAGNVGPPAAHAWTIAPPPPPPPPPLPDLVISKLTETSFTVTNTGTAAAGQFVVSVTLVGTFTFAGLGAGQSTTRVWSTCHVGTLTAIADRGRAVTESNEANNSASLVSDC